MKVGNEGQRVIWHLSLDECKVPVTYFRTVFVDPLLSLRPSQRVSIMRVVNTFFKETVACHLSYPYPLVTVNPRKFIYILCELMNNL
jgi:hypothetical protein